MNEPERDERTHPPRKPYRSPRILSRETLEVVTALCAGSPGKETTFAGCSKDALQS